MKLQKKHPFLVIILTVLVYVLTAAVGLVVLNIIPILRQKPTYQPMLLAMSASYEKGDITEIMLNMHSPMDHCFFFEQDGSFVDYYSRSNRHTAEDFAQILDPAIASARQGQSGFYLTFSLFSRNPTHLWLVEYLPPDDNGWGVLYIRNIADIPEISIGYLIYFTLFYILFVILFFTTLRKQKKLEKTQSVYVTNVTHALKAPIASVKVLTEALSSEDGGEGSEKRQKYYGMILSEVNMQSEIVGDILELSRIQSSTGHIERTAVDPAAVLSKIEERYSAICEYSDITLSISSKMRTLPELYTNEDLFHEILEILIDNALKYVGENGQITVDAAVSGNTATIMIWDNGAVIAKEDIPFIFDRFFKGQNSRFSQGTGLGLAIARELLESLNEKIWVKSNEAHGTTFYFTQHIK